MGQYYKAVLMKKQDGEWLPEETKLFQSWDYGNGAKLMEHSWLGNSFVNAVYTMIYSDPQHVGWIGDYSDSVGVDKDIYSLAWVDDVKTWKINPISFFLGEKELKEDAGIVYGEGYLINHTKKVYIDLKKYVGQKEDFFIINPLPLLTAIGNGQGGGDYRGKNEKLIGSWYLDELEFRLFKHYDYKDVTEEIVFEED